MASQAFSKGYFEPNIGYATGSYSHKTSFSSGSSTPVDLKFPSSGLTGGLRFGGLYDYLYLLADTKITMMSIDKGNNTILTGENSGFLYTAGAGIGYDWNIPIRTTAIIDFVNQIEAFNSTLTPSGLRLIVSYYWNLDFLINFEYQSATFSQEVTAGSVTQMTDIKFQTFFVNASFPFEFSDPKTSWKRKVVE